MIPSPFVSSNMNSAPAIIVHLHKFPIKITKKQSDFIFENSPELIWAPDLIKYFAVFTLSAKMQ